MDSLAPVITTNFADGATIAAGESYSNTIQLNGTVSDNYSGVVRVQLAYNNQPWRTIWSSDTPETNTTWSGEWELPAITENAQGEHTLRLRAWDDFGNIGLLEQTVFVDLLPPTNELTDRRFTAETVAHVPLNQQLDLQGVANDAGHNPLASGPIALEGTLDSFDDATIWLQPDTYESDDAGVTVAWIGDYNGDRLGDLAVGFPNGADGRGKVVIVTGQAGDWPNPNLGDMEQLFGRTPTFLGIEGAGLGETIVPAGDFNGDGFEDMLVGDLANNRVFLVYGTAAPQGSELLLEDMNIGYWDIISTENETLTSQFASAGDVNNDSYPDILIATDNTVYLLAGSKTPSTSFDLAAATFAGSNASVAGVGDVTGDFIDDFAIATGSTVYLFAGGSGWIRGGLSALTTGMAVASFATSDATPTLIGAGDLNGDGFADFAFSDGSSPVVVYGSDSGSYATETLGGFVSPLSSFLAAAGDTDKDGKSDLLIGNDDGDAYLLLGGSLTTVAATIENVAGSASAPYTKGADLAGDGSADLLIVPSNSGTFVSGLPEAQPAFIPLSALPQRSGTAPNTNASPTSGDVTVGDGDADYGSIQAAIDSGADRVLIQPGVYYEAITLTNNVIVAGSGAGLTTLMLPEGETVLVTADNVTNTSLLNLSLKGDGTGTGIAVTNGAAVDIERLLIEEMATAVSIDGPTTNVDLKNNSFIANVNGISAINCADLDVLNSIFAYNSGTALSYEACATIQRHEFNLFYANGTDQTPNDPGSGELFSNPLFYSYATGDYRVDAISPVINAGSPGDSVPPGAGSRIDIGHIEQSGGSYVASGSYCSTCDNDGLIWGINAFDTIQGAVDAAEEDLLNLFGGDGTQFTVGVDAGTYTESVTINWNLQLLGSDPDNTTMVGVGGPAVTINGTVGTKVSGFTLLGDGANPVGIHVKGGSNSVELTRNLIKDNTTGILFDGRSSGLVKFNTLINNTTAIETIGKYNWADTSNNLISGNTNGLVASNSATIFSANNLLYNTVDYTNVFTGFMDIIGSDPLVTGPYALLTLGSPAIDSGNVLEDLPTGGGIAPDIGWHELTVPPISVLMGQADDSVATESYGVGAVEYAIVSVADPTSPVSSTLPVTWTLATLDSPGEKLTYWNTTFTPTSTGYYRIYSRATDGLGNTETDSADWFDGAFYVDDSTPNVSLSYEYPTGVANTWLRITGVVTDYVGTSFDIEDIYFTIDGERYDARWSLDGWEADGVSGRSFHVMYYNETGAQTSLDIQAFAVDGAGQVGQSALLIDVPVFHDINTLYYDSTPPTISSMILDDGYDTIIPPFNDLYTGTITFEGTAYDQRVHIGIDPQEGFSNIDGYQISFDGGLTWDTMERTVDIGNNMEVNGKILPYDWAIPGGLDATTIPVKIRVTDYDGNSRAFVYTATVDTGAPRLPGIINLESGPALGQHLDETTYLDLSWASPIDGSSELTLLGSFGNQTPDVPPSTVLPDTSTTRTVDISEGGEWYASVGAVDEAGNISWMWVGPWYAGQVTDPSAPSFPWGGAIQSLDETIDDGYVDLAHEEYVVENEWLDTDSRSGGPLSLYNAWAANTSYIGVVGADWDTDGGFFLYYDLENGGTTIPISGTGSISLPFEADYALTFTGSDSNVKSWRFNGTVWEDDFSSIVSGVDPASKGFQVSRYFGDYWNLEDADNHRMMAYAVDDNGEVWATFPRNNDLSGAFEHYFDWNITPNNGDLLKLPTNAQISDLTMVVESDPAESAPLTHSSIVTTVVRLVNSLETTADDVQLQLTGSNGVTYQSVEGATCTACLPASSILLDVADIVAGETAVVTITAQLDADLTGLETVTTTVELVSTTTNKASETTVHQLDLSPPEAGISQNPGGAISSTQPQISGFASDEPGIGVELVETSIDQTNWEDANGTEEWVTELDFTGLPVTHGSTVDIYVRATDYYGQVSEPISITVVVDEVSPIITPTQLSLVGGSDVANLTGVTRDPSPENAQVDILQIRFDGEVDWETVPLGIANANGVHTWAYSWLLPPEDGITHTYQYRAFDYAGNVVTSTVLTTVVDRIAPQVTLDTDLSSGILSGDPITGTVTDGRSVDSLSILIYPDTGIVIEESITPNPDGSWSYTFDQPEGSYTFYLTASDGLNVGFFGPFSVDVVEEPTIGFTGDPSCDGTRNVVDALYIMQYEVGQRTGSNNCPPAADEIYLPACDVNGDTFCNVVDALFIMQCEVGISNSLCPTVQPTESQVEGKAEEMTAGTSLNGATESDSTIRPSARRSTIRINADSVGVGETVIVPVQVNVPAHSSLTAVTIDITYNPNLVAFDGCQTNDSAFDLSLCAVQENQEGDGKDGTLSTVSITALAVAGQNGQLLLAEVGFKGLVAGVTDLNLTVSAFEDGSGHQPRLIDGRLQVNNGGDLDLERD